MNLDKLFQSLVLTSAIVVAIGTSAKSEEVKEDFTQVVEKFTLDETSKSRLQPSEIKVRANRILGQTPNNSPDQSYPPSVHPYQGGKQGGIIPITGVEINPTDSGVEVILLTTGAQQLQVSNRNEGNNFIAEIKGAQLQLPEGKPFVSQKPTAGISQIIVTNLDEKTIQVTVVGETALPQVELFDSDSGLIFGFTPLNPPLSREESEREREAQTPSTPPQESHIVPVTGVQLNPTETGIELLLQTPPNQAEQLQPNNISTGNNFIADIPDAQLQLPDNRPFRAEKPIEGISSVTVDNLDPSTIRVTAAGETALPQVELFDSDSGLIFGLTPPPPEDRGESSSPPLARGESEGGQIVTINRVQLNKTETGFEILLLTPTGIAQNLRVVNVSAGNNFIAEIPNAQINLPDNQPFRQENPIEEVSEVTVTNRDENTVLVTVVGEDKQPTVELFDSEEGLIFSAISEEQTAQEEDIELVVTGEQDGYRVPNTSIGTRTDTPLRDIPQSIQIIPQQVLEEQQVDSLNEALRNAPGVAQNTPDDTPIFNGFTIRGFFVGEGRNFTRNGLNLQYGDSGTAIFSNIEQIEVLRGPASVLFGGGNPGGTINIVTKQPQRDPFYSIEATIGSYDFYQGAIDLTGPLNDSKTILYRLNASYENAGSFVDFVERETPAVAGALKFEIGENTDLTFDVQYVAATVGRGSGLPLEGTILPNPNGEIPRNRNLSNPDARFFSNTLIVGYNLEHRFSENWTLRNAFYFSDKDYGYKDIYEALSLEPDLRTLQGVNYGDFNEFSQAFDFVTNVVGKFSTGPIQHQLLFGADLRRFNSRGVSEGSFQGTPFDLFDPVYRKERLEQTDPPSETTTLTDSLGLYVQDQVTITDNLKLLLGGRFDVFEQTDEDIIANTETSQSGSAFSPRLGIVYQPIEPISLYASYTRSFAPTIGRSRENEPFEPGRGTQYEIGVKADINDRISATLALYDLTRTNVTTADPENRNFEIQTGEQNSQGIELFVSGEILPGWNVIAGYAYTDARITEDETYEVGNKINNVPEHSFNFWTSYEIQEGDLQGLGFGIGFFFVGDREGDLENTFALPSYFRTDAAIFYERGQFRASLNFNNLFGVEYFENSNSAFAVYPGEPFTVQGTISWRF